MRPILDVVFDGVSDAVDYQLNQILGEDRFFRLQTELTTANHDMDDASPENLDHLKYEAQQLLASRESDLKKLCQLLKENG